MKTLVQHNGQQLGPLDLEEIRARLASGTLLPTDLAWQEGMPNWVPVSEIPGALFGEPGAPSAAIGTTGPASSMAITSLVLGILSCMCGGFILGIPAVILGHLSRSQIRNSHGSVQGEGFALAGLVTGYFGTFITGLAVIAALVIPGVSAIGDSARASQSINAARIITIACARYANDHGGKFPDTLDHLIPAYLPSASALSDPSQPGNAEAGYEYRGKGHSQTEGPNHVLLTSKRVFRNHVRVVAHFDGSTALETEGQLVERPSP